MNESPDTQAEAVCWRGKCRTGCYYPDAASCTPAPSAEPDGETVTFGPNTGVTYGFGGWHFTDRPAPAQDGAEVETLAKAIWDSLPHPAASDEDPAPWKTAGDYRQNQMRVQARSLLASGWLAQRDKDRDAAVAAKVAEQIAHAIEADRDDPEPELSPVERYYRNWGLTKAAAMARAAAPAGEQP